MLDLNSQGFFRSHSHGFQSRLHDQVREKLRLKHYSIRTEQAYLDWIKRFILSHGKKHAAAMAAPEVEAFLTHFAVKRKVSASTQNQALSALLFLYKEVLDRLKAIGVNYAQGYGIAMPRPLD